MIFGVSMLLTSLTLGLGYIVLVKAAKQEGNLKKCGKIIAWFIIIIAIIGMLCAAVNTLILKKGRRLCRPNYHSMKYKGFAKPCCPQNNDAAKQELAEPKEETK